MLRLPSEAKIYGGGWWRLYPHKGSVWLEVATDDVRCELQVCENVDDANEIKSHDFTILDELCRLNAIGEIKQFANAGNVFVIRTESENRGLFEREEVTPFCEFEIDIMTETDDYTAVDTTEIEIVEAKDDEDSFEIRACAVTKMKHTKLYNETRDHPAEYDEGVPCEHESESIFVELGARGLIDLLLESAKAQAISKYYDYDFTDEDGDLINKYEFLGLYGKSEICRYAIRAVF